MLPSHRQKHNRGTIPMPRNALGPAALLLAGGLFAGNAPAADFKTIFPIPGLNDGAAPVSALIKIGNAYFGTASSGGDLNQGTIFKIDAATGKETTLHSFAGGSDGSVPLAPMIAYMSNLYGTTSSGGAAGAGTVFKFDPASGAETILTSFAGFPGSTTPAAPLVAFRGSFYGTTFGGGDAEDGTIFKIDPATGRQTTLYTFGSSGANDGAFPRAGMIVVGRALYGTTAQGGSSSVGTIFRFDPATNAETNLHSLTGDDGIIPDSALLELNGLLYGTASQGGTANNGTVFSFDPASTTLTVLHAFKGAADGAFPEAGLIAIGHSLYGTSTGFDTNGAGSVFALESSSGKFTPLYSFTGGYDGAQPAASLLADNGLLIGVAQAGGFNNNGVAFSLDPATSAEAVLHSFAGSDSNATASALIRASGHLYGSATGGGAHGYGAIFRVDAKTGSGTTLYSFKGGPDGTTPTGMLAAFGGALYGTTMQGGAANLGTVFKLDAQHARTTLHDFAGGTDGAQPHGGLLALGTRLYGTTYIGGASGSGTLFSIDPATGARKPFSTPSPAVRTARFPRGAADRGQ